MESNHYAMRRDPMTFAEAKISAEGGDKLRGTSHHPVPHGHFISLFSPRRRRKTVLLRTRFPPPPAISQLFSRRPLKTGGGSTPTTREECRKQFSASSSSLSQPTNIWVFPFSSSSSRHSTPRDWAKEWWTDSPFGSHRYNNKHHSRSSVSISSSSGDGEVLQHKNPPNRGGFSLYLLPCGGRHPHTA